MKFFCDGCQSLRAFSAFGVEGEELWLACEACGKKTRGKAQASAVATAANVPAAGAVGAAAGSAGGSAAASSSVAAKLRVIPFRAGPDPARLAMEALTSQPFEAPLSHCPKCISVRPDEGQACIYCGLIYVNFDLASVAPTGALAEAWKNVLGAWDDWLLHERFLTRATAEGALAAAGRLYRIRLVASPTDPIAAKGRDEVLRLAALPPVFARSGGAPGPLGSGSGKAPTWQYWALGGLILLALLAVGMLLKESFS